METLKRMPFKAKKSVFDELEKIVDIAALSKEERMKYDESIKVYRDNLAIASGQRKLGIEEGIEIGVEKGIGIGVEKGIVIGIEKGKEEGREEVRRENALGMKKLGMLPEQIKQVTGLSIEEINNL